MYGIWYGSGSLPLPLEGRPSSRRLSGGPGVRLPTRSETLPRYRMDGLLAEPERLLVLADDVVGAGEDLVQVLAHPKAPARQAVEPSGSERHR